jgi:hypothetical protein
LNGKFDISRKFAVRTPANLSTSGVLSPDSYSFLCRLATSYAAIINRPYAYALSLCLRRVSFAIQKELALQLTSSPAFIPSTIEDVFEIT